MTYLPELDTDDIEELASYIERRYPTEEIRIHDTEMIHFAYWDKFHRVVSATLLEHIQAAGYRVLHTGVATVPRGPDHLYFRTRYTCPRCGHRTDGPPPIPNNK